MCKLLSSSISKSIAIQDIENKYGFDLTNSSRNFLFLLTKNKTPVISKVSDLMLTHKTFDLENMTDIERANLKYLLMSTKEMLDLVKRKTATIYFKPRYARLRFLMSYEDFYNSCTEKLLLNDGILRFDANYSLECAIQFWIDRVAGWKCIKKVSVADELTVLDAPYNDDSDNAPVDNLVSPLPYKEDSDFDIKNRIKLILDKSNKELSNKYIIKCGNDEGKYSDYKLTRLFIELKYGKKELSKMIYRKDTMKLVSNQTFNKLYKGMITNINNVLGKEYSEVDQTFFVDLDQF